MTNRQWLINKMQNMSDEELTNFFYFQEAGIYTEIRKTTSDSEIHHPEYIDMWLKSEHKEKIKLSDAERVILENLPKKFKWIVRDKSGYLYLHEQKPSKNETIYKAWVTENGEMRCFQTFNHLFQFIKWSDTEPYNIEELLKGE